jgi:tyrosine-protein kinase Etk/Wzc
LHQFVGTDRAKGLSEVIADDLPIGDAIRKTKVDGLTLIPTGVLPPNPSELLLHGQFASCVDALASQYDHIVIDSPPVLAVTDATIIGQVAGESLLVLKYAKHPMREIEVGIGRLSQSDVKLRGFLFNDAQRSGSSYRAGQYSYQYS